MTDKSIDKIITNAQTLFNRRGYSNIGVDQIRDETKVSKTTLYKYFDNKFALIKAVLSQRHHDFCHALGSKIRAENTSTENLALVFDWYFAWFQQLDYAGCMFVRAYAELSCQQPEMVKIVIQHKLAVEAIIRKLLPNDATAEAKLSIIMINLEGLTSYFSIFGYDEHKAQQIKASVLAQI